MPEDPELPLVSLDLLSGRNRLVHSQKLMVLGYQLCNFPFGVTEQCEVFENIQKPSRLTNAPNHRFQTDPALFTFVVDLLPFGKVLPSSSDTSDAALRAVRENDETVVPEHLRDCAAVVREVELLCVLQIPV